MNLIKNLTIKSMLRLLVAIPVAVFLGILILNAISSYQVMDRTASLKELATIAGLATEIAHEAQKERGMTAGFLGSRGAKFGDQLSGQRQATDQRIAALKDFLLTSKTDKTDQDMGAKLQGALTGIEQIGSIRQRADGFAIPVQEAIAFYSGAIGEFLAVIPMIARTTPDQNILKSLVAYYNFVEAKEKMGIERALLNNTFAADRFPMGGFLDFAALLSAQRGYLDTFLAFADDGASGFYQDKMRDPAVAQVAEMEKIANEKRFEGGFGIDPEHWFKTMTAKINLMKEVETKLSTDLIALADRLMAQAKRELLIVMIPLIASIILLVVVASYLSAYIIRSLSEVSDGLNNGATQVSAAAGEVSSASQSLADGATQQAAAIEESSASLEEISSMTKQNADNVSQAAALVGEAREGIDWANESMTQLTTSMQEISRASEETSKIIKTIDEIAFQTNLLALNAAVEAARAGEAGAGFAVVADEVRNLAMRASEAARNTAALIEGTVKKVHGGAELVNSTDASFRQVAEGVVKIAALMGEIAAASREQATGIEQINTGVTEMDSVTQQNAATAEEAASASEELNAQAEQMKEMVEVLAALVKGAGH